MAIVGVRFERADRVQFFDPGDLELAVGDHVLAETDSGPREGVVVIAPDQVLYSDVRGPLLPVLRKASSSST
jgi:cell fate regulator YaaT (PSP1 superfamily)